MSKRLNQLEAEFEQLKKEHCTETSSFRDFILDEMMLSATAYLKGGKSQPLMFDCTDYPSITSMYDDNPKLYSGGLLSAWTKILEDLKKKFPLAPGPTLKSGGLRNSKGRNQLVRSSQSNASSSQMDGSEIEISEDMSDIDDSYDELRASTGSYGDMLDDYDPGDLDELRWQESKDLMNDLETYKQFFGETAIRVKGMPLLEMVEIDMYIWPTDVLSAATASAWGVDPAEKIGIRVGFSDAYYTNTHKPPSTLEIFQLIEGKRVKFGLSAQLENCLRNFLREKWEELKSTNGAAAKEKKAAADRASKSAGKSTSAPKGVSSSSDSEVDMDKLQQLVDMGFPPELALDTLVSCGSNLEQATAVLLGEDSARAKSPQTKQSTPKKPMDATDIIMNPSNAIKSTKYGGVEITFEYGPLVTIAEYIRHRIPQLNNYCVICDKPHVFATGNMLKPAVCSRELCIWSFQQLRVGADSADDIATEAETIDLLICMCTQAAKSQRKELILEPFPTIFHPDKPDHPVLSDANKDFALVNAVLAAMPSVEKMVGAEDFGHLKQNMDSAHALAFPMLQWIISSNRSHIVRLKKEKLVESMKTPHQYLLLSAPPEREARFRELKRKHGATWAFHGSSIENWHSILRRGLLNASGTRLMTAGAAYGNGIYLSPDAAVSFGYSKMGYYGNPPPTNSAAVKGSTNRFLSSSNVWCIAVCEVVDHDLKRHSNIWVQPHEDHVVTRFFFVYTEVNGAASSCSTGNKQFTEELKSAIEFYTFSKAEAEAAADS